LGGKLAPLTIEVRDEDDKKRGSSDEVRRACGRDIFDGE
jgi:hypothetical protein